MNKKDYFSGHAKLYAAFRPTYPEALYNFILNYTPNRIAAWDCGTGNGQIASFLSDYFEKVYATDISQNQLDRAQQKSNIFYSVSSAEKTIFDNGQFDLITVGQALHWFALDEFYNEVKRVAKNNATIAIWGYALCSVSPEIDKPFRHFYDTVVGPYWDTARKLVDEEYTSLAFPFTKIDAPKFHLTVTWSLDQFIGYLNTWSATQKFIESNHTSPLPTFIETIRKFWKPQEKKTITFPIFLKLGIVEK